MDDKPASAFLACIALVGAAIAVSLIVIASFVFILIASIPACAYAVITGKWPDWFNIETEKHHHGR